MFGQNTTTPSSTFGAPTSSTGTLFGGGDASKAFQPTAAGQDNKQNIFGGSTFGSFSFGPKTTGAPTNLFSPSTTSAPTFGANKPVSFDFGSPPNQTVGSPGFGAPQQQQQAPQTLTFGSSPQQQQPAPAFGSPAQTTTSTMPFSSPSFSFKPATTGGFAFNTPTSGFSAPQQPATATTSTAPQTTQSFFSPAATTTTNTGSTPITLGFGQTFGGGFSFGATTAGITSTAAPTITSTLATTAPVPGVNFSTQNNQNTSTPQSFSYGQTNLGFSQPTTTNQPAALNLSTTTSGFNFGPKSTLSFPTATTAGMGTSASIILGTSAQPTLTLGTSAQPTLSMGTSGQPALSLGTSAQPTISLGTTSTAPAINLGTTTSQPTLGLGTTSLGTGLSFPKPTTTAVISNPVSTSASVGITFGKTTAATTMASLTTATTTIAAVPPQAITSLTYAQLEENINKWTQELEEQEKTFINQATQLNAWDRLVIANGEKIVELNDAVETVKNEQESLEHEIGFVLAQQKELEELLAPMEKLLLEDSGDRLRDPEREHMYYLAENLERQMRQMSEDLKEVIEHLNETNRSQDSNDPIVQIGRILNAHMSSMQWIDNSIAQISTKLDQLKATHDTLRRDNERSFQKTYN